MDFSNYQFRCSQLPLLMTKSKKAGELSETVKTVLQEIWIKEIYFREKIITSKYLEKGINQEDKSIELYNEYSQTFTTKNSQKFFGEYLVGTPDIIRENSVDDIKTCWDIWSFSKKSYDTAKKDYYYQLLAYMILTERQEASIVYCLLNNSEEIITKESWGMNEAQIAQVRYNNTYDDIPVHDKVKVFHFSYDKDEVAAVYAQLDLCREYLKNIKYESFNQ